MSATQVGIEISAGVFIQSMSDRVIDNEISRAVERTVVASYPGYLAHLPAKGAPVGITGWPLVKFRGATAQQNSRLGEFAEYTLTYNQQEPDSGELPPQPVLRESASNSPRAWPEHPKYISDNLWIYYDPNIGAMKDDESTPADIRGLRYWKDVSAQVSYTQYFASDPGSIQTMLGEISPPPGESASGGKWMIIDGTRGREGRWWARTLTYGYNARGWSVRDGKGAES